MDKNEEVLCRLCLNAIEQGNLTSIEGNTKDVIKFLLLKLKLDEGYKHVLCNICCTKLFAAHNFKVICMKTEDSIFPYVTAKINMREIFFIKDIQLQVSSLPASKNVCRLCMKVLASNFIPLKELDIQIIHKYIPEVNFRATKDPVICEECFESLVTHSSFLKTCLEYEEGTRFFTYDVGVRHDEIDLSATVSDSPNKALPSTTKTSQIIESTAKMKPEQPKETPLYKCDKCPFQTKYKRSLKPHLLRHKDPSEVQMFKCDKCAYETKYRQYLMTHQLIHKDPSEVRMHKCRECSFQTKHKRYLITHRLIHKDPSEVRMFKCQKCKYETYTKSHLTAHQLCHKDSSEVQMYACDLCDFETRWKRYIALHEAKHSRDPLGMRVYKCEKCCYKTNKKCNFKYHQSVHRDASKVQAFRCEECIFETKYRHCLRKHMAKHKKAEDIAGQQG